MAVGLQDPGTESTVSLITGALDDLKTLAKQQFLLTRQEVEEKLRQATRAAIILGAGLGILLIGAVFVCLAVSHGIHWGSLPPGSDPAAIPLWVCHAIVAALTLALGGVMAAVGRGKLRGIPPLETLPTLE